MYTTIEEALTSPDAAKLMMEMEKVIVWFVLLMTSFLWRGFQFFNLFNCDTIDWWLPWSIFWIWFIIQLVFHFLFIFSSFCFNSIRGPYKSKCSRNVMAKEVFKAIWWLKLTVFADVPVHPASAAPKRNIWAKCLHNS